MNQRLALRATASALAVACLGAAPAPTSILVRPITPNQNFIANPPAVAVINDALLPTEAGPCPPNPYSAKLCRVSALDDTFAGNSQSDRTTFRSAAAPYVTPGAVRYIDPLCTAPSAGAQFQLFTHTKIYEIQQAGFLARYRQTTGGPDFLPAGARQQNTYRGDQKCPYVTTPASTDLLQTMGHLVYFTPHGVTLILDNKFNPYRWDAPINQVRHHEQASFSFLEPATPTGAAATAAILAASLTGDVSKRILLRYDLTLSVTDDRAAMHEHQFTDMAGIAPDGTDLFSITARDVSRYIARAPDSMEAEHIARYFAVRYQVPTIQLSLAVNFQQDGVRWRDSEFMLAGKNYAPSSTPSFAPVSDPDWIAFIPEGGDNGKAAWNRLMLNGLAQSRVDPTDPSLHPIQGSAYADIPDGNSTQHLAGVIDLTDYYRFAIHARIFPGTSGTWNGTPHSSLDPQTGQPDPAEHHQINWVGVVDEVHGPFTVTVQINRLDVQITAAPAPAKRKPVNRG
jgi:hypothetical protein